MIRISKFLAVSALALGLTLPAAAWAQAEALSATATPAQAGHPSEHPAEHLAEGEIRRLDPETGKLTIRHGKIRNLDMPPMTMVFTARDKARLAGLKVGDRIRFVAIHEGSQYLVTDIEPIR